MKHVINSRKKSSIWFANGTFVFSSKISILMLELPTWEAIIIVVVIVVCFVMGEIKSIIREPLLSNQVLLATFKELTLKKSCTNQSITLILKGHNHHINNYLSSMQGSTNHTLMWKWSWSTTWVPSVSYFTPHFFAYLLLERCFNKLYVSFYGFIDFLPRV